MPKHIIVVGAGIGGLSSACHLAKQGYKVTVLDKLPAAGGRASVFEQDGFRFDMGPSWYLMPDVFADFFYSLDKDIQDYLTLEQLTPSYRMYFEDGTKVDMSTRVEEVATLFESWEVGAGEKFQEFLKKSEETYTFAKPFLYKNFDTIGDFFDPSLLKDWRQLGMVQNMQKYVEKSFQDKRIQQILQYTLVFLGSAPSNTPALYNIMTHIDFAMGVWYPKGGLYAVPTALRAIAEEFGVEFIYNAEVTEFQVQDATKRVNAVVLKDGSLITCDAVVANADYHHVQTKLLPKKYQEYSEKYWAKRTMSPSAFLLYLGVKRKVEGLAHHTLFIAKDWEKHFADIFDTPTWPDTISVYVGCPSKTDPTVAPEGQENLFVLLPIAPGLEDTEELREVYTRKVLDYLVDHLGDDFRKDIIVQRVFCIKDFEERYNSYKGTALGLAHTLPQTAIMRPRNKAKKVRNLVYAGAGTVPGIGVPICLISGQLAAQRLHKIFS